MTTITNKIFAQISPDPDTVTTLYTVPANSQAKGTIYISGSRETHEHDIISVGLVPSTYFNNSVPVTVPTGNTWIMNSTDFYGTVPIYLQQICLNQGDTISVKSVNGNSQFTYLGDLFSN